MKKYARKMIMLLGVFLMMLPVVYSGRVSYALERTQAVQNASDLGGLNVSIGEDGDSLSVEGMETDDDTWTTLFKKYKKGILGFFGLAMLKLIAIFIKGALAHAANATNPNGRREGITGLIWTGVGAAVCGSVVVITALFWNAFK